MFYIFHEKYQKIFGNFYKNLVENFYFLFFYFFIFYFCLIFINNKIPTKIIGNDNHCPILTTYECPKIPTSGSLKNSVINRKTP